MQINITGITTDNFDDADKMVELPFASIGSVNFWQTDDTGDQAVPQTTNMGPDSRDAESWIDSPDGLQTTKATMYLTGIDYGIRLRPAGGTWTMVVNTGVQRNTLLFQDS